MLLCAPQGFSYRDVLGSRLRSWVKSQPITRKTSAKAAITPSTAPQATGQLS